MNKISTKFLPLKKLYYGKYSYKLVIYQPSPSNLRPKYKLGSNKFSTEYIKKINLYKEFETQKNKLSDKYKKVYPTYRFDKDNVYYSIYNVWGDQVRSFIYNEKVTLFFDNKDIFEDYYEIMKDWVLEVEKPVNDNLDIYNSELKFEVLVRSTLFKNKFKFKAIIPAYYKTNDIFRSITSVFADKTPGSVYCKENYCTITVLTNEISDLLFLQLTAGKKLKFQHIITLKEIME